MMEPRAYTTGKPNAISGTITIHANGSVTLRPAFNWLPVQEITRSKAAEILWTHRRPMQLRRIPA